MIYPADYMFCLRDNPYRQQDKQVMARVALNALVDPERYPVDLSEVRTLGIGARLLVRAFLAYMANNADEYGTWDAERCKIFHEVLCATKDGDAMSSGLAEGSTCM